MLSFYYFRVMTLMTVKTFLLLVCKITAPSPLPPRCDYLTRALGGKVGEQWSSQVASWQQCAQLCMLRPDCRYWTWHHQALKCATMRDATRLHFNPNAVSGTRHCQSSLMIISFKEFIIAFFSGLAFWTYVPRGDPLLDRLGPVLPPKPSPIPSLVAQAQPVPHQLLWPTF